MPPSILGELIQAVTDRGRTLFDRLLGGTAVGANLAALAGDLLSRRGEASGVALAKLILERYLRADAAERARFLVEIAEGFGPDAARLDAAIAAYGAAPDRRTARRLHDAAEPRSIELIRRLNLAPGGTLALVRMRENLFDLMAANPSMALLDEDFRHLFASWFNRGFLVLKHIDWSTPAHILEKIIRYEAVHAIKDWGDLRRRVQPADRRCFAFFHPALADEPLIFVEVALTDSVPDAIAPILSDTRAPTAPGEATTAVFYSISNCQEGLRGVSFGNFLIKQVVEDLRRDLPKLRNFVTLSPAPRFRRWLEKGLKLDATETGTLRAELAAEFEAVRPLLAEDWLHEPALRDRLRKPLTKLAAAYYLHAKNADGRPLDSVARFHLGNGARLERINPFADLSEKGAADSFGLMVNYLYDLDGIETNHESYAAQAEVVASSSIARLVRGESLRQERLTAEI
jgi:malonyl-CoA decarboxylase